MSREYNLDLWRLVRLGKPGNLYYRIFGCWYGGFASGDSWKLSSGVEEDKASFDGDWFTLPQSSGSVYKIHKNNQGLSGYGRGVIMSFVKEAQDSNSELTFDVIPEEEALQILKTLADKKNDTGRTEPN